MAWNETDREKYAVIRERYASDLSDEEFALIQPLLPDPKPLGRKPTDARSILNALFYMIRCGCPGGICRKTSHLIYPVQVRTRKSLGEMMRKLSVT